MIDERPAGLQPGDPVRHLRLGQGSVLLNNGPTVVVRFGHGIEECPAAELQRLTRLDRRLAAQEWDPPLAVINRVQAAAIHSVNDTWGAFSPSRIELLPHQLWVCRQVAATWPTRWLVADDVGLGKTVEAGMILSALTSRGRAQRVLILCPASLVEQWQYRMRTMFGLRFQIYTTEGDTPRAEFWNANDFVIASLQTMRLDSRGRQDRLLQSEPWDLVLIDEAHHLNADEDFGPTLGYRLVRRMVDEERVHSMVLFTGTPHRGKDYNFLSLLQLLRADLFDPKRSLREQLRQLPRVMIRNNKNNVTDLHGERLFQEPLVQSATYAYSPEEAHFYELMTEFISTGRAYASRLSSSEGRAVVLVLVSMQKLASSSVAAIRRALRGRLGRLRTQRRELQQVEAQFALYQQFQNEGASDALARMEEQLAELTSTLKLMENEESALRELVTAAGRVRSETKIERILELLEGPFQERAVLFFTEYKATQSLLMSALLQRFGPDCVTFINGDGRADDVELSDGRIISMVETRDAAATLFNSGERRFLVSTEAAGEGIDLQERSHTLIHVDLPWNPMRLHQRVGRLNRYGQQHRVEVVTLRNPDTIEALIWDRLNEKLQR
ncbi:MAG: DEAD/DEAH box helicase, partial [Actinomycetota bacterium]